jgi:hypothetical protein
MFVVGKLAGGKNPLVSQYPVSTVGAVVAINNPLGLFAVKR